MAVRFGALFCGVGIFLLTGVPGDTPHLIGLGIWWFGVLLIIDSLIGGGRPAQYLWGIGVPVAVWVYSGDLAQKATVSPGRMAVAVISVLVAGIVAVRSVRERRSGAPRYTANGELQAALSCWDTARSRVSASQRARAARAYQEGIDHFLWCVNLTQSAAKRSTSLPRPDDLMPVFHAMGAMGREGVPVLRQARMTRSAMDLARMALAASHLADPVEGNPELIEKTLVADRGAQPPLDLNGDGPLSTESRIAGAAEARLLLAKLLAERPGLRRREGRPWLIESGEPVYYEREKAQFQRAVLPSCAGMALAEEVRQLAQESLRMYTKLCGLAPGYESARDQAKEIFARSRP
ncbi:hypothetical protein [Saccharothrix stipae]